MRRDYHRSLLQPRRRRCSAGRRSGSAPIEATVGRDAGGRRRERGVVGLDGASLAALRHNGRCLGRFVSLCRRRVCATRRATDAGGRAAGATTGSAARRSGVTGVFGGSLGRYSAEGRDTGRGDDPHSGPVMGRADRLVCRDDGIASDGGGGTHVW